MPPVADLVEIGRLAKPHGLKGEVEVILTTNMVEQRTQPGSVFSVTDNSVEDLVLQAARPKKDRWLFSFVGYESRESLEPLKGLFLLAKPLEGFMIHDLIGSQLIDQHGITHGPITAIVANPAGDLVELESGLMAPTAFFTELDGDTAHFEIPDGLFEAQRD